MRFAKGHGTGNDFVILPDPQGRLKLTTGWVAALCDRRRGIGADGVLRVVRAVHDPDAVAMGGEAEWFMDYRNADGSIAQMCGNGVRVFARYLLEYGYVVTGAAVDSGSGRLALPIATRSGVVTVEVDGDRFTVRMPVPRLGPAAIARLTGGPAVVELAGTQVSAGNPNLVCRVGPDELDALDLHEPPALDPELFPEYGNVEFVSAVPGVPPPGADLHVRMRVYERGAGETMSCGSGACAVGAVALRDAGLDRGSVAVDVPGGRLLIEAGPGSCRLTGPAVIVATGEILLPEPVTATR